MLTTDAVLWAEDRSTWRKRWVRFHDRNDELVAEWTPAQLRMVHRFVQYRFAGRTELRADGRIVGEARRASLRGGARPPPTCRRSPSTCGRSRSSACTW